MCSIYLWIINKIHKMLTVGYARIYIKCMNYIETSVPYTHTNYHISMF